MSLTLLANPNKTLHALVSNANAGITQLPYTFKREDLVSGDVDEDSGAVRIVVTGVLAQGVVANDTVYWTGVDGVYPSQVYTVFSVATNALTLTWTHISDQVTVGYVNLLSTRSDYALEIQIELTDTSFIFFQVFIFTPSQAGNLFVDLAGIITVATESNLVDFLNYRILYREAYTGVSNSFTTDSTILSVLGERGIGQVLGSNYWTKLLKIRGQFQDVGAQEGQTPGEVEIVIEQLFDGSSATGVDVTGLYAVGQKVVLTGFTTEPAYNGTFVIKSKRFASTFSRFVIEGAVYTINDFGSDNKAQIYERGEFLTQFVTMQFWQGWAISVTMLIDSGYSARNGGSTLTFRERARDINGFQVGANVDTDIPTGSAKLRPVLITGEGLEPDTPLIALFARDGAGNMLAQMNVRRMDECQNPIMITWVNSLGSPEHYLFNISQEHILGVSGVLRFEPGVEGDISEVTRTVRQINADETLTVICTAEGLSIDDVKALHEIKVSENVEVYLTKDGTKRVGVVISQNLTSTFETQRGTYDFTVALEFPNDYHFLDIKEY